METIEWSELALLDLAGHRVDPLSYFHSRILLIFLRHLA
jgi:hypothetical protein